MHQSKPIQQLLLVSLTLVAQLFPIVHSQINARARSTQFNNNVTGSRNSIETRNGDQRVPFWNIAHMINSVKEIEPALNDGANGIEVDISFDKTGVPESTYHGIPCDCGRLCLESAGFVEFVEHIASISVPPASSPLQLILLDLKLKDLNFEQREVAGRSLADILYHRLYKKYLNARVQLPRPPVRVIISINHVSDSNLIKSYFNHVDQQNFQLMPQYVGFDVGMNDNLGNITAMWDSFNGKTFNIWQGDGLTNCANLARSVSRLKEAISIRNGQGHFRKIYYWTVDVLYQIRAILRFGLDAVLTNQPERVIQVLQEPEFVTKYRLATPYDDPFAQYWIKPSAWSFPIPSLQEAVETVENIQKTSEEYIKNLPNGIISALKKVGQKIVSVRSDDSGDSSSGGAVETRNIEDTQHTNQQSASHI